MPVRLRGLEAARTVTLSQVGRATLLSFDANVHRMDWNAACSVLAVALAFQDGVAQSMSWSGAGGEAGGAVEVTANARIAESALVLLVCVVRKAREVVILRGGRRPGSTGLPSAIPVWHLAKCKESVRQHLAKLCMAEATFVHGMPHQKRLVHIQHH